MPNKKLTEILQHIDRLETSRFDETDNQRFVVRPILEALGWAANQLGTVDLEIPQDLSVPDKVVYDTLQYATDVLVCLASQQSRTSLLISQELMGYYAFREGFPISVITNGKLWDLYLTWKTNAPGRRAVPWEDRIFCSIDLGNRRDAAPKLEKYLSRLNVVNGKSEVYAETVLDIHLRR